MALPGALILPLYNPGVKLGLPSEEGWEKKLGAIIDVFRYFVTNRDDMIAEYEAGRDPISRILREHGVKISPLTGNLHSDLGILSSELAIRGGERMLFKYHGISNDKYMLRVNKTRDLEEVVKRMVLPEPLSYKNAIMHVETVPAERIIRINLTFMRRIPDIPPDPEVTPQLATRLEIIPYELLIGVLATMSPRELDGFCNSTLMYRGFCSNPGFWDDLIAANGWGEYLTDRGVSSRMRYSLLRDGITDIATLKRDLLSISAGIGYDSERSPFPLPTGPAIITIAVINGNDDINDLINNTLIHTDDIWKARYPIRDPLIALGTSVISPSGVDAAESVDIDWAGDITTIKYTYNFRRPILGNLATSVIRIPTIPVLRPPLLGAPAPLPAARVPAGLRPLLPSRP